MFGVDFDLASWSYAHIIVILLVLIVIYHLFVYSGGVEVETFKESSRPGPLGRAHARFHEMIGSGFARVFGRRAPPKPAKIPELRYYHLPSCRACVQFAPAWEDTKAALAAEKTAGALGFIKINANVIETDIKSYPTLVYSYGTKNIVYEGDRVPANIAAWVRDRLREDQKI